MEAFREGIKDPYISGLGIIPIEYDKKRGVDRLKSNLGSYVFDEADNIFTLIAHKHLRKKKQLYRTFMALYYCYTLKQTGRYLSKYSNKRVVGVLPDQTIQKYARRIIEIIEKVVTEDPSLKQRICDEIQKEYEKQSD